MAAGKSMTPFYAGLGVVAVAGIALIARAAMQKSGPPLTTDTIAPLASGPRGVVEGSDSARVEIMEFSDFECPFCARFAVLQMPDVRSRLIATGRVRWRFVHFPLQNHTKSPTAHLAAACANEQGRFWPVHDLLYEHQGEWTEARDLVGAVTAIAAQAGVDRARFDQCMTTRSAWGRVLADKALGDSIGIGGTPTMFANGRQIPGVPSFDELRAIVDSLAPVAAARR